MGAAIGAGTGGLISGGLAALQGGSAADVAKAFSDGLMWGSIGGSFGGMISAFAGSTASLGGSTLSGQLMSRGADILSDTGVDIAESIASTGSVKPSGILSSLVVNTLTGGLGNGSTRSVKKQIADKIGDVTSVKKSDILAIGSSSRKSEWAEGSEIVATKAPKNCKVNMVMSSDQDVPGAWATQDAVDSVDYARNKISITPEFKKDITHVQRYLIPEGTPIQVGTVGPQEYNGVIYPGGGTQVYILNKADKDNLIPIGESYNIK